MIVYVVGSQHTRCGDFFGSAPTILRLLMLQNNGAIVQSVFHFVEIHVWHQRLASTINRLPGMLEFQLFCIRDQGFDPVM